MCGIAGFFNFHTQLAADQDALHDVLQSIRYRGPDHLGMFTENELTMGNVRLSIQDVSPRSNQPIYNEDKSVVVVYNGEIYNAPELRTELADQGHTFATGTDTEVLVHLYEEQGMDLAEKLNGMFAFALFDRKRRCLLLGRDRCGQKPLFIYPNPSGIFFCSELAAMRPHLASEELDLQGLRQFLSLGYVFEPRTLFKQVQTLEPGTVRMLSATEDSVQHFWTPNPTGRLSEPILWMEHADYVLQRAVKRHLLSDVPVTLFLSGGVDSSILALYAAAENGIAKAYTGSFTDSESHDEYVYAAELGKALGIEVTRVLLDRATLADCIPDLAAHAAQPVGDTSTPAAHCLARATAADFRVVLGGDGGDELFAGYPTYRLPALMNRFGALPAGLFDLGRRVASLFCDSRSYMPLTLQLQQLGYAWKRPVGDAHFAIKNFLHDSFVDSILNQDALRMLDNCSSPPQDWTKLEAALPGDTIRKLCLLDMKTFLLSGTIPKMERQCMRFSLENRLPLLDNEILDLSLETATSLMLHGKQTKLCLKNLACAKLKKFTEAVSGNPIKQGFTPPIRSLLDKELLEWKNTLLDQPAPYFNKNLRTTLARLESSGLDLHRLIWSICTLKSWLQ